MRIFADQHVADADHVLVGAVVAQGAGIVDRRDDDLRPMVSQVLHVLGAFGLIELEEKVHRWLEGRHGLHDERLSAC